MIYTMKQLTEEEKIRMQMQAQEDYERDMRAYKKYEHNAGFEEGMRKLYQVMIDLYRQGVITREVAISRCEVEEARFEELLKEM